MTMQAAPGGAPSVYEETIRDLRHRLAVLEKTLNSYERVMGAAIEALEHCRQRSHIHNPVGAELDGLPVRCGVIDSALRDLRTVVA